ncbi:hypothetical protein CsSME_00008256 [Camellia sinensis var. sinensis]
MVSVNEVKDLKVSVFKWNEKLYNIEESQGLFMFRINNASKKAIQIKQGGRVKEIFKKFEVSIFDLMKLSTLNSTEQLVSQAIQGIKYFSEETILNLIKDVSVYLHSCFKFDIKTSHQKPTIVIAVDVYISRTTSYMRKRLSRKQVRRQKVVDLNSENVSGKFSVDEVHEIRGMLRLLLKEPMLLWVKPISNQKRQGLHQIEAAITVKELEGDDKEVDACSICLEGICEGMTVAITPCSHMFHRDCLFKWLLKARRCPFCRSFCAILV